MSIIDNPAAWLEGLIQRTVEAIAVYLPHLVGALGILLLGWMGGLLARWVILRFGTGLDALMASLYRRTGRPPIRTPWNISRVVATLAFWLVLLLAFTGASDVLGLNALAQWLRDLAFYLPRLLIGGLILFLGDALGGLVRDLIVTAGQTYRLKYAEYLARLVSGLIIVLALLLALDQLGLDVTLLGQLLVLGASALFASLALAFGLGAGDVVRNVLSAHYVRKLYRPGQRVRVQGLEGEIIELTPVAVVLDTPEGSAVVPARVFGEQVSLRLDQAEEEAVA
jgi:small-conductance mechanosensitive channel